MNNNLQNIQNLDGVFNIEKSMQYRWRSEEDPGNGKVPRTLTNTTDLYREVNTNLGYSAVTISPSRILRSAIPSVRIRFIISRDQDIL